MTTDDKDLVERLRAFRPEATLMHAAADRIEQLSSALEFYAAIGNHIMTIGRDKHGSRATSAIIKDGGEIARSALQSLQVEQLSSGARKRAYWERPFGDAGDAVDFALDHLSPMPKMRWFLEDWRSAGADSNFAAEWPDYMRWLKAQQEGAKASALQSLQVGGE
jgi:hypothetical protein